MHVLCEKPWSNVSPMTLGIDSDSTTADGIFLVITSVSAAWKSPGIVITYAETGMLTPTHLVSRLRQWSLV